MDNALIDLALESNGGRTLLASDDFFAPKEKALALEKQLRKKAIAVLMVSSSGKAILKTVVKGSENPAL